MMMNLNIKSQLFAIFDDLFQLISIHIMSEMTAYYIIARLKCYHIQSPAPHPSIPHSSPPPIIIMTQKQKRQPSETPLPQTPLFAQIGRSFSTPQTSNNKLIFISKSISLVEPIAYSILDSSRTNSLDGQGITLLVDFDTEEVEGINECLAMLVLTGPLDRPLDPDVARKLKVNRLNQMTIEKRKVCYVKSGVYAVSCQIFLTDLLRGQATIHPRHISKIVIKLTEKVKDYYHYYAWLCTMLKIKEQNQAQKWSVPLIFVCNLVHHYAFQEDLKEVYRIFFCSKVVIWPFGRAEIHKALGKFRQNKAIKQWQHALSHSEAEQEIQQILMQMYSFLKKAFGIKYGDKSRQVDELLYGRIDDESFIATRGQYTEFQSIKSLLSQLDNVNKLYMLNTIARLIEENTCEIWNSNNTQAIELVENLVEKLKGTLFWYQRADDYQINLKSLAESRNGLLANQNDNFRCEVHLETMLKIKNDENHKINQVIKILEDLLLKQIGSEEGMKGDRNQEKVAVQEIKNRQPGLHEELSADWEQVEKRTGKPCQAQKKTKTVLIVCNTKRTHKYVSSALGSYLNDGGYLNHILSIQTFLKSESAKRQLILRRLYDKRKIQGKEGKEGERESTSKGESKLKASQIKVILEELLLIEVEKVQDIILQFELQFSVLEQQFRNALSSKSIFDLNEQTLKLKQKFNQRLANSAFKIIEIEKIKLSKRKTQPIRFQGQNHDLKIVVEDFSRHAELTHFYATLSATKPDSLIFYSPSSTQLRSLYLYCAEDQTYNLQNLHILSYQDSYESRAVQADVVREDKAFWQISQKRSQLSQFKQAASARVKNLAMRDSYDRAIKSLSGKSLLKNQEQNSSFSLRSLDFTQYRRVVIVDTREFKSSLPSYLYHFGFEVVPMFLKTADYILSDDIAVEKKSVNTKDLQNSLRSLRLDEQLRRMNSTFRHSYLLIEFEEEKDVKKENFARIQFGKGRQNSEARQLRRKLFQLMHKYQRVRVLWSTSVSQSCEMFKQLKIDKPEPDLLKFQKSEAEEDIVPSQGLPAIPEASSSKQNLNS